MPLQNFVERFGFLRGTHFAAIDGKFGYCPEVFGGSIICNPRYISYVLGNLTGNRVGLLLSGR